MIYADNAATTQLSTVAFEAMKPYLLEEYGNASQLYSFSRKPKRALAEARAIIAECIHAEPEEIYFTSGGTESDNWAIKGSALSDPDHRATITSLFEHHAILRSCAAIERLGYPVAYLRPTKSGIIMPESLEEYITNRTRLVSIMFANNEIGTVQPIRTLSEIAHRYGAIFHSDAVQAVGHVEIDVQKIGVDLLSASAHKFNGPKGVGFLYIRKGLMIYPYLDGGAQENRLRAGTENVAGIVGMAAALKENCEKLEENKRHIAELEEELVTGLNKAGIKYFRNGSGDMLPGLLSLSFPGIRGETLLHRLDLMGVIVSTGSACNSTETEISHVLQAIESDEKTAFSTIRISLGRFNLVEQVEMIVRNLARIMGNGASVD